MAAGTIALLRNGSKISGTVARPADCKWLAIAGVIWLGALTFAALAVAIGYRFMPDTVQPVAMLIFFAMSILGGLWFALAGWLQKIGPGLATYQITRIGTDPIGGGRVPMTSAAIIRRHHHGLARRVHPARRARSTRHGRDAVNPRTCCVHRGLFGNRHDR